MSGLYTGGTNWDAEVRKLRKMGTSLPYSPTQARAEARNMATSVNNRTLTASMNRQRLASYRGRQFLGNGSNMQIALPKMRQPMGSLSDQGVPFNVDDDKELKEARRWSRLFYATHDLVPLLIDIYARFPLVGLEFECFSGDTEVITDQGLQRIEDLSGGVHRILTTGGRWVEAPFKDFGEAPVLKITVQRNGRQREILATSNHRWFVEEHHQKRLGRNSAKWSSLTWDKVDEIRDLSSQGVRHIDIAAQFGVSQPMISKIVRGHAWTEVQRIADEVRPEPGWRKKEVLTTELRPGQRLVSSYGRNIVWQVNPSPFGIAAGMVFGDGYKMSNPSRGSSVTLYGEKDANLLPYYRGCTRAVYKTEHCQVPGVTVTDLPAFFKDKPPLTESTSYLYGWLAGYFAADGTVNKKGEAFLDSASRANIDYVQTVCQLLGIKTSDPYVIPATGKEVVFPGGNTFVRGDHYRLRFANESLTEKFFVVPEHRDRWLPHKDRQSMDSWSVISVEETGKRERVYCPQVPGTEAFTLAGNILTGNSKDPLIKTFHEDMFLGELNYLEFLPEQLAKEYFIAGEVSSLAHFNESLGIWSSEEILNPDMLRVSRSLFTQKERVQLLVKDLVENLRQGPGGNMMGEDGETPSERLQRNRELADLQKFYPEILEAAAQNDGLDISDALISRIVNRPTPWSRRGVPHLMRSFRTLMLEESLINAQNSVADRLFSPLVLATLGIENMGDGEPWIPDQSELDDVRDDMQSALAADFRLMVHNFGLKIENVFGRESVPNLDGDFDRVQAKLLQAWGIGEAMISGGSAGAYASSAINRELITQVMTGFQNSVRRHIIKRAEVIAEAQGHYDYDLKGGVRVPIYREIVETDPETGEEYIRKVPKLLIPDVNFSVLNLRDEAQERAFISQLKAMGVPVSDKKLAVNIDVDFNQELELQAEESVAKLMATAQAMKKVQDLCDQQNLPYPPELAQHLMSTLQLRQGKTQTELGEAQAVAGEAQAQLQAEQIEMQKAMLDQQMAQSGIAPPGMGGGDPSAMMGGDLGSQGPDPMPPGPEQAMAEEGMSPPVGGDLDAPAQGPNITPLSTPSPGAPGPGNPSAGVYASRVVGGLSGINGPHGSPPAGAAPSGPAGMELPPGVPEPTEIPRNRQRPVESDSMRSNTPKQVGASRQRKRTRNGQDSETRTPSRFESGPSSYGSARTASEEQVENQVKRLETVASWNFQPGRHPKVADLVADPRFYRALNMQAYRGQLQADWPEILNGGAADSKKILDDMLGTFYDIYGVEPQW